VVIIDSSRIGMITQINVLTVASKDQAQLVRMMTEQARDVMANQPGFISSTIHKSDDGARVVNYVQWASRDLLDAAHASPAFLHHMERYRHLVIEAGPRIYAIAYSEEVDAKP